MVMRMEWIEYFLYTACLTALRSPDPSTKVGAVIVSPDNRIISTGYNAYPAGMNQDFNLTKEEKYARIVHAEANAILNAGRHGVPLLGSTLYLTWHPCHECAKLIIQSGISEVIFIQGEEGGWGDSFALSHDLLQCGGVKIESFQLERQDITIPKLISGENSNW